MTNWGIARNLKLPMDLLIEHLIPIITAVCASLAAGFSVKANKNARAANDAVNHRHLSGTPRLYDLVLRNATAIDELIEWRRSDELRAMKVHAKIKQADTEKDE